MNHSLWENEYKEKHVPLECEPHWWSPWFTFWLKLCK